MHTILETDCFVLRSIPSREADKQLDILTKEFGLLRATATGVRHLKSKLRYSLTDYSYSRASLVRGKEFWRIITATKKGDIPSEIQSHEAKEALYRIFGLLNRLLQGEEAHPELFEIVRVAFEKLKVDSAESVLSPEEIISAIEQLTVLRVLFLLGYVKDDELLRSFTDATDLDEDTLSQAIAHKTTIVSEINHALQASHL